MHRPPSIEMCVFNITTSFPKFTLKGHEDRVCALDYSHSSSYPSQRLLVSGSDDKTVKVWSLETHACLHTIRGFTTDLTTLMLHPDLPLLLTGTSDTRLNIDLFDVLTLTGQVAVDSEGDAQERKGDGQDENDKEGYQHSLGRFSPGRQGALASHQQNRVWTMSCKSNQGTAAFGFDGGLLVVRLSEGNISHHRNIQNYLDHDDFGSTLSGNGVTGSHTPPDITVSEVICHIFLFLPADVATLTSVSAVSHGWRERTAKLPQWALRATLQGSLSDSRLKRLRSDKPDRIKMVVGKDILDLREKAHSDSSDARFRVASREDFILTKLRSATCLEKIHETLR